MPNFQIRHLRAYRAIMSAGSVTAAAKALHLTQPAVSRLLASLEEELGFNLFYRRGRLLAPSEEGRRFYRQIEGTLAGIDEITSIARDIRTERLGPVRLCAIGPLIFSRFLPEGIRRFRQEHPEIRYTVDWRDRMDIDEWIASRQADVGFTLFPVESNALHTQPITTVAAVAILPIDHRLAGKSRLTPMDFQGETIVLPKRHTRLRQMVDSALLESGSYPQIDVETSTAIASCHLVGAGLGIGISDPFSVTGVGKERLHVVRWSPELKMTYGAVWPKDRNLSEKAQRLIAILAEVGDDLMDGMPAARPVMASGNNSSLDHMV